MGKVSPRDKDSTTPKQKRRLKNSSNKYLKPRALAQLRYSKATSTKSCTDLGKKRVVVLDSKKSESDFVLQSKVINERSPILSPERNSFCPTGGPVDLIKHNKLPGTPKTPQTKDCGSESRLESLPMDLLVKILCHSHHDQLTAVFHVSKRIRKAVLLAKQFHNSQSVSTGDVDNKDSSPNRTVAFCELKKWKRYLGSESSYS